VRHLDRGQTLDAWRALTGGQWTVLDHFDKDGRRYWLARPNAPMPPAAIGELALTEREQQVVRSLSLGHSNKLIAYELGLHPSTVSQHIAAAARKLGVRSRPELLRLARRLGADGLP
jgi:DNA-binding CsgD family transcriptional regulator